jgi:uncharacterized protein YoxC
MTVMDIAFMILAVCGAVLVGVLIPTLLEVKRAMAESRRLMDMIDGEVVPLLRDLRTGATQVNDLVEQARAGVDRASVLFRAVGEVGDRLQTAQARVDQVLERGQHVMNNKGTAMVATVLGLGAGLRAAAATFRERRAIKREGGHNGH